MIAVVYTDASFCHKSKISACGFLVIYNGRMVKHTVEIMSGLPDVGVSESWALAQGLQWAFLLKNVESIVAYTDRYSLVQLVDAATVRQKTKNRHDEYFQTLSIISDYGIDVQVNYVKAHSGDKYNTLVDKSCNKILKQYLKQQRA